MRVAVIGGKLQGIEATYLAQKAGWEVLLIDKRESPPARGLCDHFIRMDILTDETLSEVLGCVDLVIPALENEFIINRLHQSTAITKTPIAFDFSAYLLSASKTRSNQLFRQIGLWIPEPYPACGFPLLIKPDQASGSSGVKVIRNETQWQSEFPEGLIPDGVVVQKYLAGPSYSIEVIGIPGDYKALQVTDLHMDTIFDCKRVCAPTTLRTEKIHEFEAISIAIAERMKLKGLMDVEVILHNDRLYLLEIDARFPSQTPMAVFHSTGINMLKILAQCFLKKGTPISYKRTGQDRGTILEHIEIHRSSLCVTGERALSQAVDIQLIANFFGADEALTDYREGRDHWVATLICNGRDLTEAWERRNASVAAIQKHFHLNHYQDPLPPNISWGENP